MTVHSIESPSVFDAAGAARWAEAMGAEQIAAVKARDKRDVQIFTSQPITRLRDFSRRVRELLSAALAICAVGCVDKTEDHAILPGVSLDRWAHRIEASTFLSNKRNPC